MTSIPLSRVRTRSRVRLRINVATCVRVVERAALIALCIIAYKQGKVIARHEGNQQGLQLLLGNLNSIPMMQRQIAELEGKELKRPEGMLPLPVGPVPEDIKELIGR